MARDRESIRAYFALVQDEALEGRVDMAAHDKARHGGRYDEATMTCKLRDRLAAGDRSDDSIRVDGAGKQKAGVGADDPDRAYLEVAGRIAEAQRAGRQPDPADVSAAREMVREAAAKAMPDTKVVDKDGLPLVVYHGTESSAFSSFEKERIGDTDKNDLGKRTEFGDGFYFTPSENYANMFAGRFEWLKDTMSNGTVLSCFINITNPLQYEARRMQIKNNYSEKEIYSHDGVFAYADPKHGTEYIDNANLKEIVVFSPSQIKSADPVTYDDAGNVIPLSRRFDMTNPDIRF